MLEAVTYQILLDAVLDEKWAAYFTPFELNVRGNQTVLSGLVQDQAELFGLLFKICDLGLRLVSVNPLPDS